MEHQLPSLPYPKDALSPYISTETMEYHHGKHHQAYVTKLNTLIKGTKFENVSLEEIIMSSEGGIFNNAAQVWNHTFFWNCLSPKGGGVPGGKVSDLINKTWGNFDKFKEAFANSAVNNFGSGWTWLILNNRDELEIFNTSNADTPMRHNLRTLLTLDVWEHAYYIDYRNARANFVDAFWKLVNWDFANQNLK